MSQYELTHRRTEHPSHISFSKVTPLILTHSLTHSLTHAHARTHALTSPQPLSSSR